MSLCYQCGKPTEDWTQPCVCGSRAFYQGRSLKGRMPDFGPDGRVLMGDLRRLGEEVEATIAPAFLLGGVPISPKLPDGDAGRDEEIPGHGLTGRQTNGRRVTPGTHKTLDYA